MQFARFVHVLRTLSPLFLGMAAGIGGTVFTLLFAESFLSTASVAAIGAGVSGLILFFVFRLMAARIKEHRNQEDRDDFRTVGKLATQIASKYLDDATKSEEQIENKVTESLRGIAAAYSSAIAIGVSVAAMGAVIAMISALAAVRQVERIDAQNLLIETQIYETRVARISSIFAAQIPSLLEEIAAQRQTKATWVPTRELQARIQTIIEISEPYLVDTEANEIRSALRDKIRSSEDTNQSIAIDTAAFEQDASRGLFSPERGQLLQILLASGLDFSGLDVPLDFSQAYLKNADLSAIVGSLENVDLGETILTGANLIDANLESLVSSPIDFTGAFLPRRAIIEQHEGANINRPITQTRNARALSFNYANDRGNWPYASNAIVVSRTGLGEDFFASMFRNLTDDGHARLGWKPYIFWGEIAQAKFAKGTAHLLGDTFALEEPVLAAQYLRLAEQQKPTMQLCPPSPAFNYVKSVHSHMLSDDSQEVWFEAWREIQQILSPEITECIVKNSVPNSIPPQKPDISFKLIGYDF